MVKREREHNATYFKLENSHLNIKNRIGFVVNAYFYYIAILYVHRWYQFPSVVFAFWSFLRRSLGRPQFYFVFNINNSNKISCMNKRRNRYNLICLKQNDFSFFSISKTFYEIGFKAFGWISLLCPPGTFFLFSCENFLSIHRSSFLWGFFARISYRKVMFQYALGCLKRH